MATRPTTPRYGIAKYGPRNTADPMDVYAVYNQAMETIDRILADLQAQISKNKKAIEDLDAKVERYNRELNTRIDNLDAKVERYNRDLNTRIDNLDAKVERYHEEFKAFKSTTENNITNINKRLEAIDGKTDKIWVAISNILGKAQGGGTADRSTGNINWGDSGKLAIGNINLNSGSGYIRTHDGTADNDLKAV